MGCCSRARKAVEARPEQKWDYINLNDFKSSGCGTPFAYGYLWFMLFVSLAVYGVDTFTAVNLLAFNQWSSEIEPAIDFDVSKWIFSICIIASFINLGFEHLRAWRVMRRGNIAECYLDSLAVRLESIRFGKGRGYKRFLVFAELTKSKKGAEYIALFSYFSFQSWIRVLLCSGPRQVINAITLYSVYNTKLSSADAENVGEGFLEFFRKIGGLAAESYQQTLILSGMLFTLVIWVFSALFLLAAILFYVFFLWHWIPKADGGLGGYCERKVNNTLTKVVHEKVNKAFAKDEQKRRKAELTEARKNGLEKPTFGRQATLPVLADMNESTDKLPEMPSLARTDSAPSLPPYTSRPASPGSIEMGAMDRKRPMPPRTGTMSSTTSFASNAPLMGNGADMGYSTPMSPPASATSRGIDNYAPSIRPGTASSQRSGRPALAHAATFSSSSDSMPPMPPPVRSPTAHTFDSYNAAGGRASPAPSRGGYGVDYANRSASPAPSRGGYGDFGPVSATPAPMRSTPREYDAQPVSTAASRPGFPERSFGSDGRASPAPSTFSDRTGPPAALRPGPRPGAGPGRPGPASHSNFQAYQPARSATGPVPPRGQGPQYPPQRNMTAPVPPRQEDYFNRPGTSHSYRSNATGPRATPAPQASQEPPADNDYDFDIYDSYGADPESQRNGRYR